jgi:hypothetical protein
MFRGYHPRIKLDFSSNSTSSSGPINAQDLPSGNITVWGPQLTNFGDPRKLGAAPTFYTINGFVYENTPTFEMCLDDNVSSEVAHVSLSACS